jgi:hypothetical protein
MPRNSCILSVSITKEQEKFINELNLSPSLLLQNSIEEQKKLFESYNNEKGRLVKKLQAYVNELNSVNEFVEYIGKFEDYRKWKNVLEKQSTL